MPGKSRHTKGKHPHKSKKSKAKQRQQTLTLHQVPDETTGQDTAIDIQPVSRTITSPTKTRTIQYPYITGELRRIGILAGMIIVILIILAIVLS